MCFSVKRDLMCSEESAGGFITNLTVSEAFLRERGDKCSPIKNLFLHLFFAVLEGVVNPQTKYT